MPVSGLGGMAPLDELEMMGLEVEDEVRNEFTYTMLLTLGVLASITLLLVCQWAQSRCNY